MQALVPGMIVRSYNSMLHGPAQKLLYIPLIAMDSYYRRMHL